MIVSRESRLHNSERKESFKISFEVKTKDDSEDKRLLSLIMVIILILGTYIMTRREKKN